MFTKIRNAILSRRLAYRAVFGQNTKACEIVLTDLANFCRAAKSTTMLSKNGEVDPLASAQADGRREVWLRISQHVNISDADLHRFLIQQQQDNREE